MKGSAYLKTGIYRDPSEGKDSTLFLNDLKICNSEGPGVIPEACRQLAGAPVND